jgi:hypothetical protein
MQVVSRSNGSTGNSSMFHSVNSSSSSSSSPRPGSASISPALDTLYLNGLQCTRVPLVVGGNNTSLHSDHVMGQDCAASRWAVNGQGLFAVPLQSLLSRGRAASNSTSNSAPSVLLQFLSDLSSSFASSSQSTAASTTSDLGSSQAMDSRTRRSGRSEVSEHFDNSTSHASTSTSNSTSNSTSHASVPDEIAQALRWLSCTSHFCCGLQVVASPTPAATAAAANATQPASVLNVAPAVLNATAANATTSEGSRSTTSNSTANATQVNQVWMR